MSFPLAAMELGLPEFTVGSSGQIEYARGIRALWSTHEYWTKIPKTVSTMIVYESMLDVTDARWWIKWRNVLGEPSLLCLAVESVANNEVAITAGGMAMEMLATPIDCGGFIHSVVDLYLMRLDNTGRLHD